MNTRSISATESSGIVCRDLTKDFGSLRAVDGLSFTAPAGAVTGFIGANGAGKTTTMRMLLGLVSPTAGEALVHGRPYAELVTPRRIVGAVLDGPGAHPGHTGRAHLGIQATAAGLPTSRIDEVLTLVDLADAADRRVGGYSHGMRQRIALGAAMLGNPQVLMLDEPASGLDPSGIRWLRSFLRRFADDGGCVLVSSHQLSELGEMADRIVMIDDGHLVADTALDRLLDGQTGLVEVRTPVPDLLVAALDARNLRSSRDDDRLVVHDTTVEEVGELAARAGAVLYALGSVERSLEDVFVRLAGVAEESEAR